MVIAPALAVAGESWRSLPLHRTLRGASDEPGRQWTICAFTEAGLLRHTTRPRVGDLSMAEATAMLERLAGAPGYHHQTISNDWPSLCAPFSKRLFGYKQVTDAYLPGLAVREGLVLATFNKGIVHLAGEHSSHVLLLAE